MHPQAGEPCMGQSHASIMHIINFNAGIHDTHNKATWGEGAQGSGLSNIHTHNVQAHINPLRIIMRFLWGKINVFLKLLLILAQSM